MFHICVNLIGWYMRYVGDINMRRGFLDKRGCIETTFRLKYEKEQEVSIQDHATANEYFFQENLLLSIIPKHIASQVGEEVSQFISNLTNNNITEKFRHLLSNIFFLHSTFQILVKHSLRGMTMFPSCMLIFVTSHHSLRNLQSNK